MLTQQVFSPISYLSRLIFYSLQRTVVNSFAPGHVWYVKIHLKCKFLEYELIKGPRIISIAKTARSSLTHVAGLLPIFWGTWQAATSILFLFLTYLLKARYSAIRIHYSCLMKFSKMKNGWPNTCCHQVWFYILWFVPFLENSWENLE